VQNASVDCLPVPLGADGEVGEAVDAAFVGPVEYFPVDEPSVAGQTDAACADSTQWEADLTGFFVAVEEVFHVGCLLFGVGNGSELSTL